MTEPANHVRTDSISLRVHPCPTTLAITVRALAGHSLLAAILDHPRSDESPESPWRGIPELGPVHRANVEIISGHARLAHTSYLALAPVCPLGAGNAGRIPTANDDGGATCRNP